MLTEGDGGDWIGVGLTAGLAVLLTLEELTMGVRFLRMAAAAALPTRELVLVPPVGVVAAGVVVMGLEEVAPPPAVAPPPVVAPPAALAPPSVLEVAVGLSVAAVDIVVVFVDPPPGEGDIMPDSAVRGWLGATLTMRSSNCFGSFSRPSVVIGNCSNWPRGMGGCPTIPAAAGSFWSWIAPATSIAVMLRDASFCGSSQTRML